MSIANLNKISSQMSKTMSHLSSGLRIVSAADDPSGVALMASFNAHVSGINAATQNAEDGLSLLQLADSSMTDTTDMLIRMRDICVKASNDIYTDSQRMDMFNEFNTIMSEIDRRSTSITFNSKVLFSGGLSGVTLQIGPDNATAHYLSIDIPELTAAVLGVDGVTTLSAFSDALDAIDLVQSGINQVATMQGIVGAQANKLERVINSLGSEGVNISAAASRISDADMASEISAYARQQVLSQAATAMIAQANAMPQQLLKLLGII